MSRTVPASTINGITRPALTLDDDGNIILIGDAAEFARLYGLKALYLGWDGATGGTTFQSTMASATTPPAGTTIPKDAAPPTTTPSSTPGTPGAPAPTVTPPATMSSGSLPPELTPKGGAPGTPTPPTQIPTPTGSGHSVPPYTIGDVTRPELFFDAAGNILLTPAAAEFAAIYGIKALYLGLPASTPYPPVAAFAPSTPADANAAANSVAEGAAANTPVGLTASSTSGTGLPLTFTLVADSSSGGFKIDGATGVVSVADPGKIDYETAPGHAYSVTVRASDGFLASTQTFTIGVTDVAPAVPADANAAGNSVAEGAAAGTLVGITAASADVNGGNVSFSISADTSNGGFAIDAATGVVRVADSSKIDYETAPGHAYSVTVVASDGTLASSQTFSIAVTDVMMSTPVDSNAAANSVAEGAAVGTTVGLTAFASDPNGPTTTYSILTDSSQGGFRIDPATGVVTVADPSKIDYESASGHAYSVVVQASNGSLVTNQTFSIAVTDIAPTQPVDSNGAPNSVAENAANGTAVGITASSSEVNGPAVTYALIADSSNGGFAINASSGIITVANGGLIDYETAPGHAYSVTVQATGGAQTTSQTFTIGVTNVNEAPVNAVPSAQAVSEDASLVFSAANGRAITISDVDLAPGDATVTVSVTHGTLTLGSTADLTSFSANGTGSVTLTGTAAHINAALDGLTYRGNLDFNGADTLTIVTNDNGNSGAGAALSDTDTVGITVNAVNDAPSFTIGATQNVLEDSGAHTVNGFATAISPGPADEAGQTVNFLVSNDNTALFSVQPTIDASGNLTYTAVANAFGTATVTVQLHDNGGTANGGADTSAAQTFVINVGAVNDAPSFTLATPTAMSDEDAGAQTVANFATAISAGPSNESAQTVSFVVDSNTNVGLFAVGPAIDAAGNLTYTAAANANGTATITVHAHDTGGTADGGVDNSAGQTFTITVNAVNDAPSFTVGATQNVLEDSGAQTVNGFATAISPGPADEAGQTVNFLVSNDNTALFSVQPTIDASGNLTYTAAANAFGTATVTVQLHDNGGTANGGADTSAAQTFVINVGAVNDAPSFTLATPTAMSDEDAGAQTVANFATAISAGPSNESAQTVSFVVDSNTNTGLFAVGPAIDAAGNLTYTAAANASGTATITVHAHDTGGTADGGVENSAGQTFTITVNAVNDAPSFTVGATQNVLEDSGAHTVNGFATAISPGPADEAGQTVNFLVSNDNTALFSVQPTIDAGGNLTYTAAANAFGTATVTVQLHDNGGTANGGADTSAAQTFVINVGAVNDAPSFTLATPTTMSDEDAGAQTVANFATAISAGPSNESAQTVSFVVDSNTNAGLFAVGPAIDAAGKLTYTAAANANGTATITVHAHDTGGTADGGVDNSAGQTFTITVNAVNDAPTASNLMQNLTINEDAAATTLFTVAPIISDVDSSNVTATLTIAAAQGVLVGAGAGAALGANLVYTIAGTVAQVNDALAGVTYDSANNFNGSASVAVAVSDGQAGPQGTNPTGTVDITVNSVNDAPSGADKTISGAGAHTFVAADFGFTDPNDNPANDFQAVEITTLPATGTLTDNGIAVTAGQFIPVADIMGGKLVFTPSGGTETASFTFQVEDNGGTANGGVDLDPSPNTITLSPNSPPIIDSNGGGDTATVAAAENQTVVTTVHATDPDTQPNAAVTYLIVTGMGSPDAAKFTINSTTGALSFATAPDFEAPGSAAGTNAYTVQVAASDGAASDIQTITVNVTNLNEAPTAHADAVDAQERGGFQNGTPGVDPIFNIIVGTGEAVTTGADSDPDSGDTLSVMSFTTAGGASTNPGTTVRLETYGSVRIAANGDATYFVNNANTAVQALRDYNDTLTDTFSYTIKDAAGLTSTTQVTVTIHGQNDDPVNTVPMATQTTNEDSSKAISGVSVTDVDSTALTTTLSVLHGSVAVTTGGGATIANNGTGTVTVSGTAAQINNALAGLTYTNTPDYNGSDTLTVSTSDGTATTTSTVAVTVTPVQDAFDDSATTTTATLVNINVNTNDSFENAGHMITAINGMSITTGGSVTVDHGSVTLKANGTLDYISAAAYTGTDTFSYTVTSGGVTETANVAVTVNAPNHAPTAGSFTTAANEDTASIPVALQGADQDAGDTFTYKLTSVPSSTLGTLYLSDGTTLANTTSTYASSQTFVFKPVANGSGTTSFQYTATDNHSATSSTATATIDVSPVADQATFAVGSLQPAVAAGTATTTLTATGTTSGSAVSEIAGGYVVAFGNSASVNTAEIDVQRYTSTGVVNGSLIRVTTANTDQNSQVFDSGPNIEKLPNGGFIVVWTRSPDLADQTENVVGRIYDASGNAGGEFIIANGLAAQKTFSTGQITVLNDGSFIVAYEMRPVGSGSGGGNQDSVDVYAQHLSSTGTLIGAAFQVPTITTDAQRLPDIVALSDGGFLVVWQADVNATSGAGNVDNDIHAQRYNASGAAVNANGTTLGAQEFSISSTNTGAQLSPSVAALSTGGWVVAWKSPDSGGVNGDIHARVFSATGVGGTELLVNTSTTGDQNSANVVALPDGGFVVTWRDNAVGASDIEGQRFDAAGQMVGGQFVVNGAASAQGQDTDAVALLGNGDIVSVYVDATANNPVHSTVFNIPADGVQNVATPITTLTGAVTDTTGTPETLSYHITGFAAGSTFNKGALVGSEWVISNSADITYLMSNPLTITSPTAGNFTLSIDAQTTDTATLSTGATTSAPSHNIKTIAVGINPTADPVFAAHDAGTFDLHLSAISPTDSANIVALPDDGTISYADGSAVHAGAVLSSTELAGLKFTPLDDGADHASNFIYSVSGGSSVLTQTLPIYVQHGVNLTLTGTADKDVIVGGAGNDTLNGTGGGNFLTGGAGADTFVFDNKALADASGHAKYVDHITDYSSAQGDIIDVSSLINSPWNTDVSELVHLTAGADGHSAALSINTAAAGAAPHWVEIASLDGVGQGQTVDVALDAARQHVAHLHVDVLV